MSLKISEYGVFREKDNKVACLEEKRRMFIRQSDFH